MSDIRRIADKLYESDDEYISRRDASLSVNAVVTGCESKETIEALAAVLVQINNAPVADVAPVIHSKWEGAPGFWHCPECGAEPLEITPYCPGCGAKMDEKEESGNV